MFSSNASQVSNDANYIEDVFSTWLYTGNGSTQTITNGIDLAGKGGLVWCKERPAPSNHYLIDTVRGVGNNLKSNTTDAQQAVGLNSFTSTGFTTNSFLNDTGSPYASWTFREQPKFFDVVTYTGNGANTRVLSHSLGSVPGCMIIKVTNNTNNWYVYHRSLTSADYSLALNLTSAAEAGSGYTGATPTAPTATQFTMGGNSTNADGATYVAYLFAHDAGGFGLTGTDNVISCGSFTGTGAGGNEINLGYEPQFLILKSASSANSWGLFDSMRGLTDGSADAILFANNSNAEASSNAIEPTATGFRTVTSSWNGSGDTIIYIAIRRGPMKVPTDGTSVFSPYAATTPGQAVVTTGFPVDFQMQKNAGASTDMRFVDRLRGVSTTPTSPSAAFPFLVPSGTDAESTGTGTTLNWNNTGFTVGATYESAAKAWAVNFRRAPGFFDEVCYTGNSVAGRQVTHNLTVAPELMIVKRRSGADSWYCYAQPLGNTYDLLLDSTRAASNADDIWYSTSPTSTTFTVRQYDAVNGSGQTYVAYLFASCPGVSKVGSVTHVEPTTVVCGFTPRFVLIKSTATTGTDDWFVFDSARGITSGNDPYLRLNSTGAENTPFGAADLIDPTADGFIMNGFGGGNYIYLAIA